MACKFADKGFAKLEQEGIASLRDRNGEHFPSGAGCGGESKAPVRKRQVCAGRRGMGRPTPRGKTTSLQREESNVRKGKRGGGGRQRERAARPAADGPAPGDGAGAAAEGSGGDPGAGPQDGADEPGPGGVVRTGANGPGAARAGGRRRTSGPTAGTDRRPGTAN